MAAHMGPRLRVAAASLPPAAPPSALGLCSGCFGQVSATFKISSALSVYRVLESLTNLSHRNKVMVTGLLCHLWHGTGGSNHVSPLESVGGGRWASEQPAPPSLGFWLVPPPGNQCGSAEGPRWTWIFPESSLGDHANAVA